MTITIAGLGHEVRESYVPTADEGLPYIGLDHVEVNSLHLSGFGSSTEVGSSKYRFKGGDILFGTLRPYFRKLIIAPFDGVCSTEFAVIRTGNIDARKFLFYAMAQNSFIDYATVNSSGARPRTKWKLFSNFKIMKFHEQERKKIGQILSAYDDLIENNRRRIQLLEESARLLYRECFVRFRFPGHEDVKIIDGVPEGWGKKQVKHVLENVKRPRKIKKSEFLPDGLIPCVDQSRDFIGGYTEEREAVINEGKPIIVFGDHTRILKFVDFPFACGADGTQLIVSNDEALSQEYLYFSLDAVDLSNYFYARHFKFLKDQYIPIPTESLIATFTATANPIMKQVKTLRELTHKLAKARDLLLPHLINGEVAV